MSKVAATDSRWATCPTRHNREPSAATPSISTSCRSNRPVHETDDESNPKKIAVPTALHLTVPVLRPSPQGWHEPPPIPSCRTDSSGGPSCPDGISGILACTDPCGVTAALDVILSSVSSGTSTADGASRDTGPCAPSATPTAVGLDPTTELLGAQLRIPIPSATSATVVHHLTIVSMKQSNNSLNCYTCAGPSLGLIKRIKSHEIQWIRRALRNRRGPHHRVSH